MLRANRYKVLSGLVSGSGAAYSSGEDLGRKIVLIEELPSFAAKKKEDFQDILVKVSFLETGSTAWCQF
jgi:hypothetical protein